MLLALQAPNRDATGWRCACGSLPTQSGGSCGCPRTLRTWSMRRSCGTLRRVDRARAGGNEASGSPFLPFLSPLWCHRLPPWPRWPPWDAGPGLLCAGCSTHSGGAPPPPPCCRPQVSAASYGAASSLQPVPKLSISHPISHLAPHLAPSNLRPAEAEAAFWTDGTWSGSLARSCCLALPCGVRS